MKGTSPKKTSMTAPGSVDPSTLHDMISKKAYELFERRGCQHGRHDEDWREAERIVCSHLEPISELGPKQDSRPSPSNVVPHRQIPRR